ncbi:hypothetical protein CVIRNUC_003914 [Coccomyxa viridis]|uniref:CHRD domain-containing protein n=1 Tax=Coccomyxa viridis TaxID=1274662 RepID=A0AAV1I482_9CHLO|nr:hypothetical protein CVIRNUC_003914 [Coccomyxa viridis]
MTGSAVIPFVQSPGLATLYIKFYRTNDGQNNSAQADYVINVANIGGITSVGLYQAPIGSNGALVAWLYGWNGIPDLSPLNGTLRTDTLDKYKLHGPQRGYNVSDLATRANDGDLYCLLTTVNNPNGELRGQVVHPDGFSIAALPVQGPPVAPVPVPVPIVIPTIVASPVPVPVPAPVPAPPSPSPAVVPVVTAVPVVTNVTVPAPAPSPAPPPPSPPRSPSPAVVPVVTAVPVATNGTSASPGAVVAG